MMRFSKIATYVVLLLWCVLNYAAALASGDDERSIAFTFDFGVNLTKERQQGFRFVTPNPFVDKDVGPETHETLISNEMGKQQYCLKGWEILSTPVEKKYSIYEGVCK